MAEDNQDMQKPVQQQVKKVDIPKTNPLRAVKTEPVPIKLEYAEDRSKNNRLKGGNTKGEE